VADSERYYLFAKSVSDIVYYIKSQPARLGIALFRTLLPAPGTAYRRLSRQRRHCRLSSADVKEGRGGENQLFSIFKRHYLENGSRYGQSYC